MADQRIGGPCSGPWKVPSLLTLCKNRLESLLFKKVEENDLAKVENILSVRNLSLNSNDELDLDSNVTTYETPLTQAAKMGSIDIMRCLLEHGADVDQVNCEGQTPLGIATTTGNLEAVRLLIEFGCDVNKGRRYLIIDMLLGNPLRMVLYSIMHFLQYFSH